MKALVKTALNGSAPRVSGLVICCADFADPGWRWIEGPLSDAGIRFEFVRAVPRNVVERRVNFLNVARFRAAFETVRLARERKAQAIVAHGPALGAWCGLFARLFRVRLPIVAHTFNFTELPNAIKRSALGWMLSDVDRFVVFSELERSLYAKAFNLPENRFDVICWGAAPPDVDPSEAPVEVGAYVCSIGGNARDYCTLLDAARMMPHIRFVCVARADNLRGIAVPDNVTVRTNVPLHQAMNILAHSRFMVLPLLHSEVPCGHVTIVAAMHLGKAIVITDSAGVRDYVQDGYNAVTIRPRSTADLIEATERLWSDPALCKNLAENGRRFARRECTEERVVQHFRDWLASKGFREPDQTSAQ
ncbi:glycosyltransferase family 4 protein [Candidatus Binatus sp.]|uniref:glycosyltransferase family 4 protein n=1 Tax=Candidatus Binatus sp. TaxID=2811406 RepID=UPI003BB2128A